ncbi:MAG: hypothetical protein RL213_696 [Bacteroidota bacterium]|jgi:gliding motility-associated-like protein
MIVRWKTLLYVLLPCAAAAQCPSTVSTFPYAESFESGTAGWSTGGTNSDWALGTPAKATIASAGDGSACWITGGLGGSSYSGAQRSWLQSPCFDISSLQRPELAFLIFWETEYQYDGGNLQYSLDGGSTWRTLGSTSSDGCKADHWYTISSVTNLSGLANPSSGWSGTLQPTSGSCRGGNGSGAWVRARYCLQELKGSASVRFRFTFGSGTTCNDYDGIAVDLFEVYELPPRSAAIDFSCLSSRTVLFEDLQPDCINSRQWDFGDGTVEANAAAVVSHTFTVAGDWNITLTSVHVCLGAEQVTIPVRTLGYTASIRPVSCAGGSDGSILLSPLPAGIASLSVSWSDNTLSGPSPGSLPEGDYIFSLDAADACPLTDTLTVSVDSLAFFRPDLGADRFFCPDDPVPLRTIGSYSGFLWQDGSTSDTLVPSGEGWYWVRVVSMSGCPGTDSVYLELNCMDIPFFPSAFTPNGDLVNDVFTVTYGSAEVLQWQVFDRWGKSVFRAMDTFAYWDGAGFPQGVYTCMVDYLDRDGLQRSRTGRVTLIR